MEYIDLGIYVFFALILISSIGIDIDITAGYLEGELDVVAWLPDAHSLQHACVPQLPEHQVIIKP